jgi:hypothetical protein
MQSTKDGKRQKETRIVRTEALLQAPQKAKADKEEKDENGQSEHDHL